MMRILSQKGPLIFNPSKKKEIWRFLTYQFVHSGYFHICFNILVQVSFSINMYIINTCIIYMYIINVYNINVTIIKIPFTDCWACALEML